MGNDSNEAEGEFPAGRNIGCCSIAGITVGREHVPACVNYRPPVFRAHHREDGETLSMFPALMAYLQTQARDE